MKHDDDDPRPKRWAQLRFSIIGALLASPPDQGELRQLLAALEQWPRDGVPANPRSWLVSAGRFKGIDRIRRQARFDGLEDFDAAVEPEVWGT